MINCLFGGFKGGQVSQNGQLMLLFYNSTCCTVFEACLRIHWGIFFGGRGNRNIIGKFRHGGKIPSVGIGKRPEKIPLWWEISLCGRKKVFCCMDHLVLRHPSYMRGFTYPFSLSGGPRRTLDNPLCNYFPMSQNLSILLNYLYTGLGLPSIRIFCVQELDLYQWILTKDSDWGEGYSSAEFNLNSQGLISFCSVTEKKLCTVNCLEFNLNLQGLICFCFITVKRSV